MPNRPDPPSAADADVTLPAGDPARAAVRRAARDGLAAAVLFTAFAEATSHIRTVRAGNPWQDDPYDAVVSFTLFLVPALAALAAARSVLLRRDEPQPGFRIGQLLRAWGLSAALIAATALTDWTAVALRADRGHWNAVTPWIVASLTLPTAAAAVAGARVLRARRLLPPGLRGPGRGAVAGDWLDDLAPLARELAAHLPAPWTRAVDGAVTHRRFTSAVRFGRRHVVGLAGAAAGLGGALLAAAEAVGEGWTDPLLWLTAAFVHAGGFFAFAMLCNATLSIAVPRTTGRTHGPARATRTGRAARAGRRAVTAAALAVPLSGALRAPLRPLIGRIDTVPALAELVLAGAAVAGVLTFVVAVALGSD
ncbi:hypothetical protein [Streptacidiphilus jiangxiensis]|uniref:Uncharacterized protein n=1 Tax=Streptacidiphilus jiangxiensis TaxID=235985 RepID=A0A1H7ZYB7_STRJI|nr:hypothetical protein [Streptacidiphilus jiangxiensis]SEM62704.1 hypothetical protein SAMN05414137_13850 [Streptacidiphilus jiangxiensis]